MSRKAIGGYTLSNCGGLAVYDINDERAIVGLVTDHEWEPEECPIDYDENGDPYFLWGSMKVPLSEVMRLDSA